MIGSKVSKQSFGDIVRGARSAVDSIERGRNEADLAQLGRAADRGIAAIEQARRSEREAINRLIGSTPSSLTDAEIARTFDLIERELAAAIAQFDWRRRDSLLRSQRRLQDERLQRDEVKRAPIRSIHGRVNGFGDVRIEHRDRENFSVVGVEYITVTGAPLTHSILQARVNRSFQEGETRAELMRRLGEVAAYI